MKVTLPSASTSNLPTFGTSFTVAPLSNSGVESAGNGTGYDWSERSLYLLCTDLADLLSYPEPVGVTFVNSGL